MHLKEGSFLKGGEFRIEEKLGQGGFGITYLGLQVGLNRKVAIKEFFMKEYCNRDEETSRVTVPSLGSQAQVERFREKFVKEAQTIASLENNHIIRIYDVFQENGTAYYVMEYHENGSLLDLVKHRGGLNETDAVSYIRQMASALQYIHGRKIAHLDIKPSNVLLDSNGHAVLIDFGMSKRYDDEGEQTSTTPVGISHGYAPLEQYKKGGVGIFSPAPDIYSLGATLYKLVTGVTPPDASEVETEELSASLSGISAQIRKVILQAMQLKNKDRPQSVDEFLSLLDSSLENVDEGTVIDVVPPEPDCPVPPTSVPPTPGHKPFPWKWRFPLIACLVLLLALFGWNRFVGPGSGDDEPLSSDSLVRVDTIPVVSPVVDVPIEPLKDDVPSTTPLYVSTSPVGATVYLDGKKIGKSPLEGQEVSRGNHTVKLVFEGYETFTKKYVFGENPVVISEVLVSIVAPVRTLEKEEVPKPVPVKVSTVDTSSLVAVDTALTSKKEEAPQPKSVNISTTGTINGHEWVDLGLSVKWATMNVGATEPDDYGDYFAWGEVHPKSKYTKNNSITRKKDIDEISGNSSYDAARYHWGGSWRLPTKSELDELLAKCSWSWVTQNGHKGYKFTGPNGNSIFLPAAGYRYDSSDSDVGKEGNYWSGSSYGRGSDTEGACGLFFYKDYISLDWLYRRNGRSVRPVLD